ncbi:MAG: hypothetical protein KBF37_12460, partial [Saprospiraceae bacterium]|nr:hypothetical protein [Saprospiraceae bacterium]
RLVCIDQFLDQSESRITWIKHDLTELGTQRYNTTQQDAEAYKTGIAHEFAHCAKIVSKSNMRWI